MEKQKKGISVRALSIGMLIFAGIMTFFSIMQERSVDKSIAVQTDILVEQREETELVHDFLDVSDYLTEQVNYFATTEDVTYLQNYWTELDETRSREKSVESLEKTDITQQERELIEQTKENSDYLVTKEAWAMRLVADSIGMAESDMPEEVAEVVYEQDEATMTNEEKKQSAISYLFGKEYAQEKQEIRESMTQLQDLILERKQTELEVAVARTQNQQRLAGILTHILLFAIVIFVIAFTQLVLRPLNAYGKRMQNLGNDDAKDLQPAGGKEAIDFANIFNEIHSEFQKNQKELENEQYRFRMAIENSPVAIFDYDYEMDTYYRYGNIEQGEYREGAAEKVVPGFLKGEGYKLVDRSFWEPMTRILRSKEAVSLDAQICQEIGSEHMVWARITATPVLDKDGNLVKMFGKVSNIEKEKEKERALEDLQMRDSMTGLYNRDAGIRMIKEYLKTKPVDESCAIFLLDMDHFEEVNHEEGSVFADAVLQETANILRSAAGEGSYHIRLGGDEFMVLAKNCDRSRARVIGPAIAERVKKLAGDDGTTHGVSVSIGMCSTDVTDKYEQLYHNAESTLQYVKKNCIGTAACYLDVSKKIGKDLSELYTTHRELTDIAYEDNNQGAIISYAIDLLEGSKNLDDAVRLLLSRIGRDFEIDRVSIVEINQEYMTYRYQYQWTALSEDRQRTDIYYITPENIRKLTQMYDNGISTQYMSKKPEKMNSILHVAIWNDGAYEGFMSFEKEAEDYQWSDEQKRIFKEITKVITSFTLRAKADSTSRAKTEFLSRMSHEIRTPMNAISGMTDIALESLADTERVEDCLKKIKASNTYLAGLINDILDMSRIESGKMELSPQTVILKEKLEELTEMLRPQFEQKQLVFKVVEDYETNQTVRVDFLRLSQVLLNLLSNALKFSFTGGEVTLRVEQTGCEDGMQTLKFMVSDQGKGIRKEAMQRIFNAFEQESKDTATTHGGTGLGLAISSRLVKMMGGRLQVESKEGEGASFYFTISIPVEAHLSEKNDIPPNASVVEDAIKKGSRILIVEDNELNREIAETLLTMNGFIVEHAENGKIAVETFAKKPAHYYDVILMDIRMPVMDGLEAARRIRILDKEDSRSVPIIAMTANAFDDDMQKSIDSGMNGHLTKPFDLEKLLDMLRKILANTPEEK